MLKGRIPGFHGSLEVKDVPEAAGTWVRGCLCSSAHGFLEQEGNSWLRGNHSSEGGTNESHSRKDTKHRKKNQELGL